MKPRLYALALVWAVGQSFAPVGRKSLGHTALRYGLVTDVNVEIGCGILAAACSFLAFRSRQSKEAEPARALCISGPVEDGDALEQGPKLDCHLFGEMLERKGVKVSYHHITPESAVDGMGRETALSIIRANLQAAAPMSILYFSGHGISGSEGEDDTRGALLIGQQLNYSAIPLADLKARAEHLSPTGHKGMKETYASALNRECLLSLDDILGVWSEAKSKSGAARRRLLLVVDACYSGKLVARLRRQYRKEYHDGLDVGIQAAGNARQRVYQGTDEHAFSHGGAAFTYAGRLTGYLTAKQGGARVRWTRADQHPQFYCTWDPGAAEETSVEVDLGNGNSLTTFSRPNKR